MGKTQKKTAKGRLDKWYKLAKEQGYRSRAAFKLVQLNKKYGFLEKSRVVIDLCAAPGGWMQVASKTCKPGSIIVGVDLAPIKPVPGCESFVEDITTDKCRSTLNGYLKSWKADVVLHDGAPNVGTAWLQDAYTQAELVLMSLKLATEFLVPNGTFVTKVFRSQDYNNLLWVFNQLFNQVEATKPPSSRNVSAEIFVVCRGYKAPAKLDPRFLDPKSVFDDVTTAKSGNEAKVFHPEKRRRQREGYEDGDYTLFKTIGASEFVKSNDPVNVLGSYNSVTFDKTDAGDSELLRLPETSAEVKACFGDLRVLGKREFRMLLKWRLACREHWGMADKKAAAPPQEETATVQMLDEDEQIDRDLAQEKAAQAAAKKRERRRMNEQKQKATRRMQLGMTAPMDIGKEVAGLEEAGPAFDLADMERAQRGGGKLNDDMELYESENESDSAFTDSEEEDGLDSDVAEADRMERELDSMYSLYQQRKAEKDPKFLAREKRKKLEEPEWEGIKSEESQSDSDSDEEGAEEVRGSLLTSLETPAKTEDGLSKRAALFFGNDLFDNVGEDDEMDDTPSLEEDTGANGEEDDALSDTSSTSSIEVVPQQEERDGVWDGAYDSDEEASKTPSVDIVTAEAMTLAQQMAGRKTKHRDILDDGYNRWAFHQKDGVPDWFMDDENKHNKPSKPVTKEAADALREKMRALNARPIKKILEAQGRKKHRAMKRLQRMQKKAESINESTDMTEREKAQSIQRMMNRAAKSKPKKETTLVVAKGANKALRARPKGVKGRYKMVDPRMKKETRAMKRVEARQKKHR